MLSKIGRWLATEHPQITEPAQWTRQTCAAWVAAVDNLRVDDYVQQLAAHEKRTGQPVTPHTKAAVGRAQHRTRRPAYQPQQSALPARTAPGLIADLAVQRQRDRSPPRRLRPLAARRLPDPRRLRRGAGPRRGLPARRPHPQDRHLVYQTRRPDPGQGDRDMANLRPQQPRMLDRKTSEHVDLLFATREPAESPTPNSTARSSWHFAARPASPPPMSAATSPATAPGQPSPASSTTPRNP
jgi:hypothetical protein